ncbi:ECF transporter S component [Ligilactobacillus ruminis]|uniref:ECF transporter S component n=1 Tax=Ligilactobacillus ruminis TaxID=1623 RepID=UPI002360DA15|nr:ECF transporter S component [Ligilactobacillus ruminis]WDC80360.1 ECF transporter S component [Ligilactobacillus ruminis]
MQTYDAKKEKKTWELKDVIFLAVIGIFFGIIYQVWSYAYYAMAATPLKPFANDATLGVWIMAGPLAGVLIRKAGASVIGEMLAAAVEMLLFSSWGASTLISGFVQGIGSELGFAATGYRDWGKRGLFLSTLFTTSITFVWDLAQSGYMEYHLPLLTVLFVVRFISIGFFAGVLVAMIAKMVDKAGVLKK